MKQTEVSRATMGRLPVYLEYLKTGKHLGDNISATSLAKQLGLGEVQVRKDLSAVSGAGRPKTGYKISELIKALEIFLGFDQKNGVILVGAGKLGRALLDYSGFGEYGLEITAAFDKAVSAEEKSNSGKSIYPMDSMAEYCKNNNIRIGIITVPSKNAQQTADSLIKAGIKAIWCFAPCKLSVPEDIVVQYENMALSLAYLNKKI